MRTLYNRFVHRNIFYHAHILVKPKQFMRRTLSFWESSQARMTRKRRSHVVKSVQGYVIYVDVYETKRNNQDVIVLIHGHFSDKTEFDTIIPSLQKQGYDVAVYNVYGEWKPFSFPKYTYGKKEKHDLHAIVEQLEQYERIHLVGHSLGAAIVAEYTNAFQDEKVCTMTMVALYETLDKAIEAGVSQTPMPFFTLKINPQEHMEHFSNVEGVELYTQDMKEILDGVESNHLLVFGENDQRAPYFEVPLPTEVVAKAKHTTFFTSQKGAFIEMLHQHIKKHSH